MTEERSARAAARRARTEQGKAAKQAKVSRVSQAERARTTLALYNQVNTNFRKLTDIRFKLLALLPLATGVASLTKVAVDNPVLSVFAAAVTIGLWVYDQRNNQHYDELVGQAAFLERSLEFYGGPFDARPRPWWQIAPFGLMVEHRWPIDLIYGASLTVWLTWSLSAVCSYALERLGSARNEEGIRIGCGCMVAAGVWLCFGVLHWRKKKQSQELRDAIRSALRRLLDVFTKCRENGKWKQTYPGDYGRSQTPGLLAALLAEEWTQEQKTPTPATNPNAGIDWKGKSAFKTGWEDRLKHYFESLDDIEPRLSANPTQLAAYVLGQMTDLPPRWIVDVGGRRATHETTKFPWGRLFAVVPLFIGGFVLLVLAPKAEKIDLVTALNKDIKALLSEPPQKRVLRASEKENRSAGPSKLPPPADPGAHEADGPNGPVDPADAMPSNPGTSRHR
jgi:hypothetical protein